MTVKMEKNYAWYTEHVLWCFVVSTIIQLVVWIKKSDLFPLWIIQSYLILFYLFAHTQKYTG